jgi:hypothetical protein
MTQYTIELTQAEDMALAYAAFSQQEWIDGAVKNRCRVAIEEIMKVALEKSIETSTQLPVTQDEIVMLAFSQGWVKTGAQRNAEYDAERAARQGAA